MKNPQGLPPFSGYCHIQLLRGQAAQAADTAKHLATFRRLAPAQQHAEAERNMGRMLASMVLVFLLWCLSNCQAPDSPTTTSSSPTVAAERHPSRTSTHE